LHFSGFATCSGASSHCRPLAQDKASWRGQASTSVDGSSQFDRSRCLRAVSKRKAAAITAAIARLMEDLRSGRGATRAPQPLEAARRRPQGGRAELQCPAGGPTIH
jgi:hypothetical protein